MGVYIKDEKMPKSCTDCFYAKRCNVCVYKVVLNLEETIFYIGKRPDECPLEEVDEENFPKK